MTIMEQELFTIYETPEVYVLEVQVEKGFATSMEPSDWGA